MGAEEVLVAMPRSVAVPEEDRWAAYAAAWGPLQDDLFRIARLLAASRADAEDAVAEALAATYRPWCSGRVVDLRAYARRAVVNQLVDRGRRKVVADRYLRRRFGEERGGSDPGDVAVDRQVLRRALRDLPVKQRAIVVLRFYADLSVADTAELLGCAEGTVKSQTHDALATLRDRLGRAEEAPT